MWKGKCGNGSDHARIRVIAKKMELQIRPPSARDEQLLRFYFGIEHFAGGETAL